MKTNQNKVTNQFSDDKSAQQIKIKAKKAETPHYIAKVNNK